MHKQVYAFAADDVGELSATKITIEQHNSRATLGRAKQRIPESPMIAGENADTVSGPKALAAPGVGHCVRACFEVGKSQRAAVVDQRDSVTVTERRHADRRSDWAVGTHRTCDRAKTA